MFSPYRPRPLSPLTREFLGWLILSPVIVTAMYFGIPWMVWGIAFLGKMIVEVVK